MPAPRVAVGGATGGRLAAEDDKWAIAAVRAGGGTPVGVDEPADAAAWLSTTDTGGLADLLSAQPGLRWVQLPTAGIGEVADAGLIDDRRAWTCAKGCFAEPVAEHALGLAIAGLRGLRHHFYATAWGEPTGTSLYDQAVTIIGGGGVTRALLALLAPFRVRATVVRRQAQPVPGAAHTVTAEELDSVLPGALVVFVTLALTPATRGIVGAKQLAAMDERAWLVNVARGPHVDTDALTEALALGAIAGAALDVTEPEPLPDDHPLWQEPRCLITPHSADTWAMIEPLLAARLTANVRRFAAGEPLEGLVDVQAGY